MLRSLLITCPTNNLEHVYLFLRASKNISRLFHFLCSEGQAMWVSEGQLHHFYTKVIKSSRMFWKTYGFLNFILDATRELAKPLKTEDNSKVLDYLREIHGYLLIAMLRPRTSIPFVCSFLPGLHTQTHFLYH